MKTNFHRERAAALTAQIDALRAEAEDIIGRAGDDGLSDEDTATVTDRTDQAIALKADLAEALRLADELDELGDLVERGRVTPDAPKSEFNINTRTDPFDLSDVPQHGHARFEDLNARAFDMVEKSRSFGADDHKESATQVLEQTAGRAAQQIILSSHPKYVTAFAKVSTGNAHEMDAEEKDRMAEVDRLLRDSRYFEVDARALSVGAGDITGKLVPAHLDPSVVLTNNGAANPFRQLGRVVPVTTNVWTGVSSAGITIGWTGTDGTEVGDDAPSFSNPAVTCAMWDAFVPLSFQAYEDWFGGEQEILMMVADAKDRLEAQSFATGSGSNQPVGIVTALSGTAYELAHATNNSFTVTDLFALKNALPRRYRSNASLVMNEEWLDRIRLYGTNQGSLYTVSLDAERPDRVFGRPTYDASGMTPTMSSAATNNAIVYGDFSNYLIADRVGTVVEFVPNLFHTGANRPSGQRGWLVHGRTGADSINDAGFILSVNPKVL